MSRPPRSLPLLSLLLSPSKTPSTNCSFPLKSTLVYKDRHTDIRLWPARRDAKVVILFICGNPGLIDYYEEFLSAIHAHNEEPYDVIGLGHESHSTDKPLSNLEALNRPDAFRNTRPLPSLQEQIDRKIDFVDRIRATYPAETKLVLIGHSVGAYICQEVIKARPDAVDHFQGLFPTISHIAISPNGLKLAPMFRPASITLIATTLILLDLLLPASLLHLLVRLATGQSQSASQVTTRFIQSPASVASSLLMAADEMATIKDLDVDFLRKHGHKVTLYFAAGNSDGWVGSEDRVSSIVKALDSSKNAAEKRKRWHICDEGMPHAFCIDHSPSMARKCAEWIAADLAD